MLAPNDNNQLSRRLRHHNTKLIPTWALITVMTLRVLKITSKALIWKSNAVGNLSRKPKIYQSLDNYFCKSQSKNNFPAASAMPFCGRREPKPKIANVARKFLQPHHGSSAIALVSSWSNNCLRAKSNLSIECAVLSACQLQLNPTRSDPGNFGSRCEFSRWKNIEDRIAESQRSAFSGSFA